MAIRPRNDKYQIDVTYKGTREFATADSLEAARIEEAKLLDKMVKDYNEKMAGRGKKAVWKLGFACDQTIKVVWSGTRSEKTNEKCLKDARSFFGDDLPLDDITVVRLDDYKASLKTRGNGAGTINRKLAVLSKVMSHAIDREGLDKKPKIEMEATPPGRVRVLSPEEETTAFDLCAQKKHLKLLDVMVCLIDLGFRESELFAIQNVDVHDNGTVTTWLNKTDKPRTVPMSKRVAEIIRARCKTTPSGPLFPHTLDWLTGQWRWLRAKMGLKSDKGFVPYCLRHSCATRLVQRGVPPAVVQKWMGHSNFKTTLIYVHLQPEDLMRYANVLEATPQAAAQVVNGAAQSHPPLRVVE